MVPKPIKTSTLITSVAAILITEFVAGWMFRHMSSIAILGLVRSLQISALVTIVLLLEGGLDAVGFGPRNWLTGIQKGVYWSLGFAVAAGLGMAVLYWAGQNPIAMVRFPLPSSIMERLLFFVVGGLIAPLAEEICFRGVLYTYFRRWGILLALVASTAIFVALHAVKGIPVTQIVGGVVFAIAYETSGNLMVAVVIHTLGNLALFSLSLL